MSADTVLISVVMTIFSRSSYMEEAVRSILNQTYKKIEFLIIVEHGADSQAVAMLEQLAREDGRIRLLYNPRRLGLAESLNFGIREARGKYIARMDDDDVSLPQRLKKQLTYMESHEEVGLCGTLQISITPHKTDITTAPVEAESLKSEMLFGCQLSHTSVMFRRELFLANGWFYNPAKLAEDYDLWMRILNKTKMVNLAEPLVKHRFGFGNLSLDKGEALAEEFNQAIQHNLQCYLGINCSSYPKEIFCSWRRFPENKTEEEMAKLLTKHLDLLLEMEKKNRIRAFAEASAFMGMLMHRFRWFYKEIVRRTGKAEFFACIVEPYRLKPEMEFWENLVALVEIMMNENKQCSLSLPDRSVVDMCLNAVSE